MSLHDVLLPNSVRRHIQLPLNADLINLSMDRKRRHPYTWLDGIDLPADGRMVTVETSADFT